MKTGVEFIKMDSTGMLDGGCWWIPISINQLGFGKAKKTPMNNSITKLFGVWKMDIHMTAPNTKIVNMGFMPHRVFCKGQNDKYKVKYPQLFSSVTPKSVRQTSIEKHSMNHIVYGAMRALNLPIKERNIATSGFQIFLVLNKEGGKFSTICEGTIFMNSDTKGSKRRNQFVVIDHTFLLDRKKH
jgi:hypothetical protein